MKKIIRKHIEDMNNSRYMFGIPREKFWKMWILSHDQFEFREDFARDLENKILFYLEYDPTETQITLYNNWGWYKDEDRSLYDRLCDYYSYCSDRNKCAKFFDTSVYDIEILPYRGELSYEQKKKIEKIHRKNWFNNRKIRETI